MTPSVEVAITRSFEAAHSLAGVGVAERHEHEYRVTCGYEAAIDPTLGCTRPMQDAAKEIEDVLARLEGKYLNEVLCELPPTAEILACWILAQMAPYWDWVSIRAYDGFMCRVERAQVAPWMEKLRAHR